MRMADLKPGRLIVGNGGRMLGTVLRVGRHQRPRLDLHRHV